MGKGLMLPTDPAGGALRAALFPDEQRRIAFRLGSILVGAGLILLGWLFGWLSPGQESVVGIIHALAALIVAVPILFEGLRGFLDRHPFNFTEQVVSLAVLAAMSQGDFVTAALVPLLLEVGHLFEERSVLGARAAIEGIRQLQARKATRLDPDGEHEVSPQDLVPGDRVIVRPGELIPAEARVLEGRSSVDQSTITGESRPEEVEPGSLVYAATTNTDGLLVLEVIAVGADTALGKVITLLREAENSKAPIVKLLERYASFYLPTVLSIAAIVLFASGDLNRAIAVLVVSCPCALVLAGPSAMVAAMAVATRLGILIKGPAFLERASEIDTLMLDKTGTVTLGTLAVSAIHPSQGVTEQELLCIGGMVGQASRHGAARAVADEARKRGILLDSPSEAHEEPGKGTTAILGEQTLRLGRGLWLRELGLPCPELEGRLCTRVWVARGAEVLGHIELADQPRREAREALSLLRESGVKRLVLLTGDRKEVAGRVVQDLGFDDWEAEILPERKAELVEAERAAGRRVMMVGDGVNDALALHTADVGVSIGTNVNEVTLGGADVALMSNNLLRLPQMMRLARLTRSTIGWNVLIAGGFSVVMLALASFGLISPLLGALLHNGGAICVVLNSARILRFLEVTRATPPTP